MTWNVRIALVVVLGSLCWGTARLPAQGEKAADAKETTAAVKNADLAAEQAEIAEKFKRFEAVLLRMAELTAPTDPRRAALLRQAVAQSKERALDARFDALIKFLQQSKLALAVNDQGDVQKELSSLMELLLSENREENLASEQARIREYLKRVNKLIKDQKSLQGQTSGQGDPKSLAGKQGKAADDAKKLAEDIKKNEEDNGKKPGDDKQGNDADPKGKPGESKPGEAKPGEAKPGEAKPGEAKPGEAKPGEAKPGEAKPGESKPDESKPGEKGDKPGEKKPEENKPGEKTDKPEEGKPAEGKPSKPSESGEKPEEGKPSKGKPMPGQPMPGQPSEGKPSDSPPQEQPQSDEDNPARKRIQAAEERMRKAQEKLEEAKRKDAADEQEQALRELEQAKADLEKILRQLREEEIERMLAQLEGRFRKMLQLQVEVYEGTLRLDRIPVARRARLEEVEAGKLSLKEAGIALEAQKALLLLREEGSAVAMPEAVAQMHEDMLQVAARLGQQKVETRTQGLEEDIIAALEEMIEALQKAQQDMEDGKSPPPGKPGQPQDQALIDQIAELKMIRSLQLRVNRRTQRYADLIEGQEQAVEPDLIQAVQELAEREERIFRSTRDIVTGKNK